VKLAINEDAKGTLSDLLGQPNELTINGIKVTDTNTYMKIGVTVNGNFSIMTTKNTNNNSQKKYKVVKFFVMTTNNTNNNSLKKYQVSVTGKDNIYLKSKIDPSVLTGDASVRMSGDGAFDTENSAVFEAKKGDTLDFKAVLNVSSIKKTIGKLSINNSSGTFKNPAQSTFTLQLAEGEGLVYPTDPSAYNLTGSNAFNVSVNGSTITMSLKPEYNNFKDLQNAISNNSNTQDYLVLTIKGIKITDDAPEYIKAVGSVSGDFNATLADFGPLSMHWTATQDHKIPEEGDGTDYMLVGTNDRDKIQLTIHVQKPDTEHHHKHSHHSSELGDTTSQITVTAAPAQTPATPAEAPAPAAQPAEVAGVVRDQAPAENGGAVRGAFRNKNQSVATGDDSNMMVYGIAALAAAAGFAMWTVMSRRRTHR
jgi:hypothetical protein